MLFTRSKNYSLLIFYNFPLPSLSSITFDFIYFFIFSYHLKKHESAKIEDKIQRRRYGRSHDHCPPPSRQRRIKDVTSFSCLLLLPRKGTKFRFVSRQERGGVERKERKKRRWGMGGLVNNTKRQVARKRRYFSGCTRAGQSNKNERRPRLKKDEKRRQRKFITGYIYIYIHFQCYVNVVVYRNNGERNEGLRAIPFPLQDPRFMVSPG